MAAITMHVGNGNGGPDHFVWLIEQGHGPEAALIVAELLVEDPHSADGRTLRVLQRIFRGEMEHAKFVLDQIGDSVPKVESIAVKLEQVRARMATLH